MEKPYRDKSGHFTSKENDGGECLHKDFRQNTDYEEILKTNKFINLPKKEYGKLCSLIRTKYADKIPPKGSIYVDNYYYRFKYNRQNERILCSLKIQIAGNEELIKYLENNYVER